MVLEARSMSNTDTLIINFSKEKIRREDSLYFDVSLPDYKQVSKLASLHLWIEEITTGRQWHYRYPLLNGHLSASLKVGSQIAEGDYAFTFSVQKQFFNFQGKINNPVKSDEQNKILTYVLIAKDKESIVDVVKLKEDMSFSIHNLLFQDSAFIIFSRPGFKKNELQLNVSTPLDSVFIPLQTFTQIISVCKDTAQCGGTKEGSLVSNKLSDYRFSAQSEQYKTMLPVVTIKGKARKTIEDFEKDNVSGMFTGISDFSVDGITSDELEKSADLFLFLSSKIPGLRVETDGETGSRFLTWRKKPTTIFLNEIKMDTEVPLDVNTADIALIKVYRPGNSISANSGEGGTVSIYLKSGEYLTKPASKYGFYVMGYTGVMAEWK